MGRAQPRGRRCRGEAEEGAPLGAVRERERKREGEKRLPIFVFVFLLRFVSCEEKGPKIFNSFILVFAHG